MAAKRLGTALTNLTGTASQLLRVKSDESGFEFFSPATIPAYTVSNGTVDRSYDADTTTIDEIADVLRTLIGDLSSLGAVGNGSLNTYVIPQYSVNDPGASPNTTSSTITHNLGTTNLVVQLIKSTDGGSTWNKLHDFCSNSSGFFGFSWAPINNTQITITMFRHIDVGSWPILVKGVVFAPGISAGMPAFQWSSSEQVWPFEKASDGGVLYCKEIAFGALPNNTTKSVAHGISNLAAIKVHSLSATYWYGAAPNDEMSILNYDFPPTAAAVALFANATNIAIVANSDFSTRTCRVRIIYAK